MFASRLHWCMCLFKCAYQCLSFWHLLWLLSHMLLWFVSQHAENIHSLLLYVCVTAHVCVDCMCYVLPYVWSILVFPK